MNVAPHAHSIAQTETRVSHPNFTNPNPVRNSNFWSEFLKLWTSGRQLDALHLIGDKFIPFRSVRYESKLSILCKCASDTIRKLKWKIAFPANGKPFVTPPWGYIASEVAPSIPRYVRAFNQLEQAVVQRIDQTVSATQPRRRRSITMPMIMKFAKAFGDIIINADKNMGLFVVTLQQYHNMGDREIRTYKKLGPVAQHMETVLLIHQNAYEESLNILQQMQQHEGAVYVERWNSTVYKSTIPDLYFLAKVHKMKPAPTSRDLREVKAPIPHRPILPYNTCKLYAISKVVAAMLNAILPAFPWVAVSSYQFVHWYRYHHKGKRMRTGDATNLFGSIPPKQAVEILIKILDLKHVREHLQTACPAALLVVKGRHLLVDLVVKIVYNTYLIIHTSDGEFIAHQTDGLCMGGPIVSPLANLHMAFFEFYQKGMLFCKQHLCRYLDDECTDVDHKIQYPRYIVMIYSDWNTDFEFLDVHVHTNGDTTIAHKNFKSKPPRWASCSPGNMKMNYFQSHLCRAARICSTEALFEAERLKLRHLAEEAEFPKQVWLPLLYGKHYDQLKEKQRNKVNTAEQSTVFCIQPLFADCNINVAQIIMKELQHATNLPVEVTDTRIVRARIPQSSIAMMMRKLPRYKAASHQPSDPITEQSAFIRMFA